MNYIYQLSLYVDQPSLLFALVPAALICTLSIFFIYLTQRRFRGMGEWSVGFFFLLIAFCIFPFLLTQQDILIRKLILLFGNYFFLTGNTVLLFGTRRFFGLTYNKTFLSFHLLFPIFVYFFCLFFLESPRGRFFGVSIWGSYIFFNHVILFFRFKTKETFFIDTLGIIYTFLLGLIFFVRAIWSLTTEKIPEHLYTPNQFLQLFSFFGVLSILGLTIIFILIRSSRLESELHSKMDELLEEIEKRKQIELVLSQEASTDALTGIGNRRKLFEQADHFFRISKRYFNPFSMVICDIDHFKNVNDSFGHDAGDFFLKEIANILKLELRSEDVLARYGGEEFVILLPETKSKEAIIASERIRRIIEKTEFDFGKKKIFMTCSFGISYYKNSVKSVLDIIKRADKALYKSKAQGRNRVSRI